MSILNTEVSEFLRILAVLSPYKKDLIENHANRIISEYVDHKKKQGVVIDFGPKTIIPPDSHGIFIIELNRNQLMELGIMSGVMEKMIACFTHDMGLLKIQVSDKKPMPEYREWAFTKLISGKYHDVETNDETTHIIINF